MREQETNALTRLSAWVFSEFRIYRKYVHSGPYIMSVTAAQIRGIRVNVNADGETIDKAIHKAVNEIERIRDGFLSKVDHESSK